MSQKEKQHPYTARARARVYVCMSSTRGVVTCIATTFKQVAYSLYTWEFSSTDLGQTM